MENNNYLQIGRTIECGACNPEKFRHCDSIAKQFPTLKPCNCICHNPQEKVSDWGKGLRQLPQLYKASKADIIAIENFINSLLTQREKAVKENVLEIITIACQRNSNGLLSRQDIIELLS